MPLPTDEKLLALTQELLHELDGIFEFHPGFRATHAKGAMLSGAFSPSREAATLSRAPHLNRKSTSVTVRFSNSTGLPAIADNASEAEPRGFAVRFHLAEHSHTDIIGHSTNGFPTHTGQEFLQFLRATAASKGAPKTHPSPREVFLRNHPKAQAFEQAPKPAPTSFARDNYFGVTAMRFTNKEGVSRYGRYRIVPEAGVEHLEHAALVSKDTNYLFDELAKRITKEPIKFRIKVQLANEGDVVNDVTIHWPEDRQQLELGTLELTRPVHNDAHEQKQIIFDPIPRVDGIDPSDDPLLELRAAVYLMSGQRRRTAPEGGAGA